MRSWFYPVSLLAVMSVAVGGTSESSIGVTFPDEIAGFQYERRTEFPQKALGVNIRYVDSGPVVGSIYVYTNGLENIPSGIDAPVVRKHFSQIIAEVKQLESLGKARAVDLSTGTEQNTKYEGCGPQFMWRAYEIDVPEGVLTSYTYLTSMKNNFIKLRMSYRKGDDRARKQAERFVQSIRKILGGCP